MLIMVKVFVLNICIVCFDYIDFFINCFYIYIMKYLKDMDVSN